MNDIAAIVRTKNSAITLRASLSSLRWQSVPVTVVIVDSGSTDDTVPIAEELADHVVHLSSREFSYGRALNLGAEAAADAEVHIALSSHCTLPRQDWAEIAYRNLSDRSVVATVGADVDPFGVVLQEPIVADQTLLEDHPWWGMSNHAAAWSAPTWRRHPFDEELPACEDKEWSLRATSDAGVIVFDPKLVVSTGHRRTQGTTAYVRRFRREVVALSTFAEVPAFTVRDALTDFVRKQPKDPYLDSSRPMLRTRLLDCLARYLGDNDAARERGNLPQAARRA